MPELHPVTAILCGGRGTRLGNTLGGLPKPMAPIGGRPLLEHLVGWALAAGAPRVMLCAGYGAAAIRTHFAGPGWTGRVEISEETEPLGTGGALRLALPRLTSPGVLVLNGDSYVPGFDPDALFAFRRQRPQARGFLVLTPADARTDAGNVSLDAAGRIQSFAEKQPLAGSRYRNAGIYLLDRGLLEAIPPGRPVSLENELLPLWLERGLYGYVHAGALVDIGTPERLRAAQDGGAAPFSPA